MKTAVILSGGLGMRLRPFTSAIPKPLLPIGEKAILEIQIERLAEFGFERVFLATNYKSNYIKKFIGDGKSYGIDVKVSEERKSLGTAGPLKLLENELNSDPFLVMNGDILTLLDIGEMYKYACSQDAIFTAGVKKIITPYDFGNIHFEGDNIIKIEEKPDIITYAIAGVYIIKPEVLNLIPSDVYYGMDQLMKDMLDQKITIRKYDIEEYWIDIGRMDDYERVQNEYINLSKGKRQ